MRRMILPLDSIWVVQYEAHLCSAGCLLFRCSVTTCVRNARMTLQAAAGLFSFSTSRTVRHMWSLFDLHKDPHRYRSDRLLTRAPGSAWLNNLKHPIVKLKRLPRAATQTSELTSHGTLSLENRWRLLTLRSPKQPQNIIRMTNGRLPGRSFECLSALAEINLVSIHFSPGKQIRAALLFATLQGFVRHVRAQLEWKSHFKLVPVARAFADIDTQACSRCTATEQVR